jgi:hypothetical protein
MVEAGGDRQRGVSGLTEDGGAACDERARADAVASGDQKEIEFVDSYYRARKASGAAYHITDIAALERLAAFSATAARRRPVP